VVEEVVVTGSVSRGVADDVSDVEMLVVSAELPGFHQCMAHARAAGCRSCDHPNFMGGDGS